MRSRQHCCTLHPDENPQHNLCLDGDSENPSWCFYKSGKANGENPTHTKETMGTALNADVAKALKPVYDRLSQDSLMLACSRGQTNEGFHFLIRDVCPKVSFMSRQRIEAGVETAINRFNMGATSLGLGPSRMGTEFRSTCCKHGQCKDI